ncbi:MAG: hypothetical protein IJU77_13565, partial [Butyrivibrio sp.]|nr:hypothetical protein [Butyrivibrio sp.]
MKKIKYGRICTRAVAVASALFIGMSPMTVFAHVDPATEAEEVTEEDLPDIVPEEPAEDTPIEEYGPLTP